MQPGYTINSYQRTKDRAIFSIGDPVTLDKGDDSFSSTIEAIELIESGSAIFVHFANKKMICSKENLDLLKHSGPENKMAIEVLSNPIEATIQGKRLSRPAVINITNTTSSPTAVNILGYCPLLGGKNFPDGIQVEITDENNHLMDLKRFLSGKLRPDFLIGLITISGKNHGKSICVSNGNGITPRTLPINDEGNVLCNFWLSKVEAIGYVAPVGKTTIKLYPTEINRK